MSKTIPSAAPQWARAVALFVAGVVLTVWLVARDADSEGMEYLIGRLSGAVLLSAIVAVALLWRSPLWFRLVWLLSYSAFLIGIGGAALYVRDQAREVQAFERDVAEASEQFASALVALNQGREPGRILVEQDVAQGGDRYRAARIAFRTVLQSRVDSRRRYESDLDAADLDLLLEPRQLRGTGARSRADGRIAATRAALDAWIERERRITQTFLDGWSEAELPARFQRDRIMQETFAKAERDFERVHVAESAVIDAAAAAVDILLRYRWELQDGQVLFHSEDGMRAYNAAVIHLQEESEKAQRQQNLAMMELHQRIRTLDAR